MNSSPASRNAMHTAHSPQSGAVQTAPRTVFLTAEQRAIVGHTGQAIIVAALAGTGKTTTLASKLLHFLQHKPQARILVLACSQAGAAAFRTRLQQLAPQAALSPQQVNITSLERWCARHLRQRDAQVQFLSDPVHLRQEALAAAATLQEHLAREPDALVQLPHELDVDAFWQFHRMAQKSLLIPRWQDEGCSLEQWCDQHLLDYSLARWLLAYERHRLDRCGDARYYAEGDCTFALAQEAMNGGGHDWGRYDLILFDELHDLDLASLQVLRQLLQRGHTQFVGAGDFNQHIEPQACSVLEGQLQQLQDFLPTVSAILPLTVSRRFGPHLADAINQWFNVDIRALPQRSTQVHRMTYTDDAHCIALLGQARQTLLQHSQRGDGKAPPLTVLLRHDHDAVALQWMLHSANYTGRCIGIQPLHLQKEIALLLGLMYAHGMQDPAWKASSGKTTTSALLPETLAAFVDAALTYGKGQVHTDTAQPTQDDSGEFEPQAHYWQPQRSHAQAQERQALTQTMAQEMHHYPQGIWRFLIGETHLQGGQRNFAAFGRFLNLPVALQSDAGALLKQADVWGLFDAHPMPRQQREQLQLQVQAFIDVVTGLPVAAVLQHITAIAQRQTRALRQGLGYDFQLISIPHAKGHEFEAVAIPFLEPGRFPAPCAYEQKFLERNRLYVAMTRAKRHLWLLESQARPIQRMDAS